MQPLTCQSCRRPAEASRLTYRRGTECVAREGLLQCDLCERFACADCLEVYDIFSGYDFLCHICAQIFLPARGSQRGH